MQQLAQYIRKCKQDIGYNFKGRHLTKNEQEHTQPQVTSHNDIKCCLPVVCTNSHQSLGTCILNSKHKSTEWWGSRYETLLLNPYHTSLQCPRQIVSIPPCTNLRKSQWTLLSCKKGCTIFSDYTMMIIGWNLTQSRNVEETLVHKFPKGLLPKLC